MLYREYLKMDYPIKDGLNKYRGLTGNDINFINNNKLILIVNSGLDGNCSYLFEDDGMSNDYKEFIRTNIKANNKHASVNFCKVK